MKSKLPKGTLQRLWDDPKHWRAGGIYVSPEDPRSIVPKRRTFMGWTVNFGHRGGWIALLVMGVSVSTPIIYLSTLGLTDSKIWYETLLTIVILTCLFCSYLASPKRFED
jgi:hypothetical protein